MKVWLGLVRQEIAEYMLWLPLSLAAGILIWLAAFSFDRGEYGFIIVVFAMLATFIICSIWIGGYREVAGILARRPFELARPISAFTLCSSKAVSGILTVFSCVLLVGLPVVIALVLGTSTPDRDMALPTSAEHPWLSPVLLGGPGRGVDTPVPDLPAAKFAALLAFISWLTFFGFFSARSLTLSLAGRSRQSLADLASWLLFYAMLWQAGRKVHEFGNSLGFLFGLGLALTIFPLVGFWSDLRSWQAGILLQTIHRANSRILNPGLLGAGLLILALAFLWTQPDVAKVKTFSLAIPAGEGSTWLAGGPQNPLVEPLFLLDSTRKTSTYLITTDITRLPKVASNGKTILYHGFGPGTGQATWLFWDLSASSRPITIVPAGTGWDLVSNWDLAAEGKKLVRLLDPKFGLALIVHSLPDGAEEKRIDLELTSGPYSLAEEPQFRRKSENQFEILLIELDPQTRWSLRKILVDVNTGEQKEFASWPPLGVPPGAFGFEAARLFEEGLPFPEVANPKQLVVLENRAVAAIDGDSRFYLFEPSGALRRSFDLTPQSTLAGEIRPGLLLVGLPPALGTPKKFQGRLDFLLGGIADWQTWVIDADTGEVLRSLQGFAPMSYREASQKIWLVDKNGEPYDLDSVDAEPRRILPWRPRG